MILSKPRNIYRLQGYPKVILVLLTKNVFLNYDLKIVFQNIQIMD